MKERLKSCGRCDLVLTAALILVVAGCGGGTPSEPSSAANNPPTAGTIRVSPTGTGIAGMTSFTFSAQGAQDADGNPLAFTWNFGDGASLTAPTPTHTYSAAGSFTVTVAVSDGKQSVNAASVTVVVGSSLTAPWTHTATLNPLNHPHQIHSLNLIQSGSDLAGDLSPNVHFWGNLKPFPTFVTFPLTGMLDPVSYPATVSFTTGDVAVPLGNGSTYSYSFVGETTAAGGAMTGTLTQEHKFPPVVNRSGGLYCGSRAPIVICPPEIASSVVTLTRR